MWREKTSDLDKIWTKKIRRRSEKQVRGRKEAREDKEKEKS